MTTIFNGDIAAWHSFEKEPFQQILVWYGKMVSEKIFKLISVKWSWKSAQLQMLQKKGLWGLDPLDLYLYKF
jgi:hypothetical protein